jgi:hypothetical protein
VLSIAPVTIAHYRWRTAGLGRKRSFKVDAAFWVIAGFDHFVITIKIASEVKMRNRIKEFLSLR